MTQPTDRPGIDELTSDRLDQLYDELWHLRLAQAGADLALQAACRKTDEQRERADKAAAEVERMKLLVAASSEDGQAVRMAAQYAERAIENGERAEKAEAERAHAVRIARSAAFDTAKALTAQLLADQRAEQAEATLTAVRKLHDRWECDANVCAVCVDGYGTPVSYPCPTTLVLDQHGQTPKETT